MSQFPLADYSTSASLTITLNSLGSGSCALSSNAINNTGGASSPLTRFDEIEVEVVLASLAATASAIDGALIPSRDGANFQTISGSAFPVGSDAVPIAYAWVDSGTSAKRGILRFRRLGPFHYKVLIRNGLGVSFAGSGNSAGWRGTLRETR